MHGVDQILGGGHVGMHILHGLKIRFLLSGTGSGEGRPGAGFARWSEGIAGHPVGEGLPVIANGEYAFAADEVQAEAVVLRAVVGDGIEVGDHAELHFVARVKCIAG